MASRRFDGVTFRSYPNDHQPRHVHGFYAEVEVIVDLRADGTVALAKRTDAISPSNASKSDVRKVFKVAAMHFEELVNLWERNTMRKHEVVVLDAELDAALQQAKVHDNDPVAQTVEHIPGLNLLMVGLSNGRRLVLPVEDLEGLEHATHEQLTNYELAGRGTGISFPDLDIDFYVPALMEGVYGTRRWMAKLGKRGGSATTDAKKRAARQNGTRGGRPRKSAAVA